MATDKLGLYNDALLVLGQRKLASLTENREPRRRLDGAYTRDAINYCLEVVKPSFATRTAVLNAPAAGTTFDYAHSLPADYVTVKQPYSDAKLDQKINRYIIEGDTLLCDYDVVYFRYVAENEDPANWDASFVRVVGAYLASEIVTRVSPDEREAVEAKLSQRIEIAIALEAGRVPAARPADSSATLTNTWLKVYNDALQILGLDEITQPDDDSNRRFKLDRALDADLVNDLLEDTGWQFGQVSIKIQYDPSAEPSWGYNRALPHPPKMHRLDGIYTDEYMRVALKLYKDEEGFFFCDYDEVFVTYISTDYLVNPSQWPTYFRRLVAARMAMDAAPSLRAEGADPEYAVAIYEERKSSAMSNDAMQSPPHKLAEGNWTAARFRGGYRRRP